MDLHVFDGMSLNKRLPFLSTSKDGLCLNSRLPLVPVYEVQIRKQVSIAATETTTTLVNAATTFSDVTMTTAVSLFNSAATYLKQHTPPQPSDVQTHEVDGFVVIGTVTNDL